MRSKLITIVSLFFLGAFHISCTSIINDENIEPIEKELPLNFGLVVKDSIPLRNHHNLDSTAIKYVYAGLQLKIIDASMPNWFKITNGESKGRQLGHGVEYWIEKQDLFISEERDEFLIDISLYETDTLEKCEKYESNDYLYKQKILDLSKPFYVSGAYTSMGDVTCQGPLSICSETYKPSNYYLFALDVSNTDAHSIEELESRYNTLYDNGTIKPFFTFQSNKVIDGVSEKLIISKSIMDYAGCYDNTFITSEVETLVDTSYSVKASKIHSNYTLNSENIFTTTLTGEVQDLVLIFVLNINYGDGEEERLCKRIKLWRPLCL